MDDGFHGRQAIPAFGLYGEGQGFPDVLHHERITDRAARHGWRIAPHRHPDLHQFLLIEAGHAEVSIEGQMHVLPPATLLNIPRRTVHGFTFEAGVEGAVLSLPVSEVPEAFAAETALSARLSQWGTVPAAPDLIALIAQIGRHQKGDGIARAPMLRALALQVACWFAEARKGPEAPTAPTDRLFRDFEDLVQRHFRDRWRVQDYAAALRVSPTHLNRVTRATTGQSALKLIEALLFREARRQLAYTRQSVAAIALSLGYEDPSYFSRAFRAHVGQTPGRYRAGFG